jgi:hypothetical protein
MEGGGRLQCLKRLDTLDVRFTQQFPGRRPRERAPRKVWHNYGCGDRRCTVHGRLQLAFRVAYFHGIGTISRRAGVSAAKSILGGLRAATGPGPRIEKREANLRVAIPARRSCSCSRRLCSGVAAEGYEAPKRDPRPAKRRAGRFVFPVKAKVSESSRAMSRRTYRGPAR